MNDRWTDAFPRVYELLLGVVLFWLVCLVALGIIALVVGWLWSARWRVRRPHIRGRATRRWVGRLEPTGAVVEVIEPGAVRLLPGQSPGTDGEFGWGYAGPGAERLAAFLLEDHAGYWMPPHIIDRFAEEVVAKLPLGDFELDEHQLRAWLAPHLAARRLRWGAAARDHHDPVR